MKLIITLAALLAACGGKKSESHENDHEMAEEVVQAGSDMANGGKPHAHGPEMIKIAPDMMRDLRVTTGKAQSRAAGETVSALGELRVNEEAYAEVASPVSARVTKILAKPGDTVKAGQVLAELNSPELGQGRAEVDAARARLEIARKNADRKRQLVSDRLVPEREQIEAEAMSRGLLNLGDGRLGDQYVS